MEKKLTKKDYFAQLLAIEGVASRKDLVDFINHEVDLLSRKNTSGKKVLTENQKANEILKAAILEEMEVGTGYSVTDMLKHLSCCKDLSNQKVSALMKQLLVSGLVAREEVKGKAIFSKVAE